MITIVGLGPSKCDQISMGAYCAIRNAPIVFVRTIHHPAVEELVAEGVKVLSMDSIYESSDTFEQVYEAIASYIIAEAEHQDVVYAVPGHPLIGEISVQKIINKANAQRLEYRIFGSESFIEASMAAMQITLDAGLKIIDALSIDKVKPDPNIGNLIYQLYNRDIASEVKLALMDIYPDDFVLKAIIEAGMPDEQVIDTPLYRMDWRDWNHLTTIYVPPIPSNGEDSINRSTNG